jgi:hypothetical protein
MMKYKNKTPLRGLYFGLEKSHTRCAINKKGKFNTVNLRPVVSFTVQYLLFFRSIRVCGLGINNPRTRVTPLLAPSNRFDCRVGNNDGQDGMILNTNTDKSLSCFLPLDFLIMLLSIEGSDVFKKVTYI